MRRITIAIILAIMLIATGMTPVLASSHREAPLIANDPVADNTDLYVFRSPDKPDTVTIIANYLPFEEPAGGPNFYKFGDDVLYQIHIFNKRSNKEDITYQFRFTTNIQNKKTFLYNTGPITSLTDKNFNIRQTYSIIRFKNGQKKIFTDLPTPPVNIGPKSTPNYAALANQAIKVRDKGNLKVFAGQRDDPFFVDLGAAFDLLTIRMIPGNAGGGIDGLAGFNVQTIAIQVPIKELTANGKVPTNPLDPNAVIGVYASASRKQTNVLDGSGKISHSGNYVQVSRLAEPLVNELLIPVGEKDRWNASNPVDDNQFIGNYRNPEPARLINTIFKLPVPKPPRDDIVAILLKGFSLKPLGINFSNVGGPKTADLIRLNVAVPPVKSTDPGFSRLGILGNDLGGFPNGRRLEDDVVDIELRALAGATPFTPDFNKPLNNQLGDGVNANDVPFLSTFPYVATPHDGFSSSHGKP